MPLDIDFIDTNPVTAGFNAERQQQRVQQGSNDLSAIRNLQIEELGRTRDTQQAVDKLLRDIAREQSPTGSAGPPPGPGNQMPVTGAPALRQATQVPSQGGGGAPAASPASGTPLTGFSGMQDRFIQGSAEIPGAGQAGFDMAQSQNADATAKAVKALEQYFEVLKTGDDPNMIKTVGDFAGVNVPPEILQNAQRRQQLAIAGQYLKFYSNDLASFGKFLADATQNGNDQTGPDYQGAFARNPPTNQAQSARGAGGSQSAYLRFQSSIFKTVSEMFADSPEQAAEVTARLAAELAPQFGIEAPIEAPLGARLPERRPEGLNDPAATGVGPAGPVGAAAPQGPAQPARFDRFPGDPRGSGFQPTTQTQGGTAIDLPLNPDGTINPGELVPTQVYNTARGPATWDGRQFFPVQ